MNASYFGESSPGNREELQNKNLESDQTIVNKKTRKRAARGGLSIRVWTVPLGTELEYGKTCDRTGEGLTHAIMAFSAPDNSGDAFILRDDPP